MRGVPMPRVYWYLQLFDGEKGLLQEIRQHAEVWEVDEHLYLIISDYKTYQKYAQYEAKEI